MKKRWLIRSIFMGLLTLCVTAWVGSFCWEIEVYHYGERRVGAGIYWGRVCAFWVEVAGDDPKWGVVCIPASNLSEGRWSDKDDFFDKFNWCGFCVAGPPLNQATIPFWFPTLLSALLLWFVWRKTKAKPRGSPVEVAGAKTEGRQA